MPSNPSKRVSLGFILCTLPGVLLLTALLSPFYAAGTNHSLDPEDGP